MTHNNIGFARKKAQTISFVERGFERLDLGHQTVGFSWCSYMWGPIICGPGPFIHWGSRPEPRKVIAKDR